MKHPSQLRRLLCALLCGLWAACATTSEDGLRPPDRAPSTYWRTMVGTGVPLETALASYGEDLLAFLTREGPTLRVAAARGAGPLVTDLAHVMDLAASQVATLGEALRASRAALEVPLSEAGPFTPERARRLAELLQGVRPVR